MGQHSPTISYGACVFSPMAHPWLGVELCKSGLSSHFSAVRGPWHADHLHTAPGSVPLMSQGEVEVVLALG